MRTKAEEEFSPHNIRYTVQCKLSSAAYMCPSRETRLEMVHAKVFA